MDYPVIKVIGHIKMFLLPLFCLLCTKITVWLPLGQIRLERIQSLSERCTY